jgi:hypothetical protein
MKKPVQTYLSKEDYETLKRKAESDNILIATYVRKLILKDLK